MDGLGPGGPQHAGSGGDGTAGCRVVRLGDLCVGDRGEAEAGKLTLPEEATRWFPSAVALFGIEVVDIDEGIALNAAVLEWDHRDPADRIVVATALARGMSVVTADSVIASYARVDVVW